MIYNISHADIWDHVFKSEEVTHPIRSLEDNIKSMRRNCFEKTLKSLLDDRLGVTQERKYDPHFLFRYSRNDNLGSIFLLKESINYPIDETLIPVLFKMVFNLLIS